MKLAERRYAPGRLSIHTQCVLQESGEVRVERTVDCPRRMNPLAVDVCLACPHARGEVERGDGRSYLRCLEAPARDARERLGLHTPIAEVMNNTVLCVRDDVSLDAIGVLFELHGIDAVPVVDELGRPIGLVSKSDLSSAELPSWNETAHARSLDLLDEPGSALRTAADVMTASVLSLPPHAKVAHAAASMASRQVHRAVVVAADRRVIGIVSSLDLLRFVAAEAGFFVEQG